jgi:PGF-pre-PGF domain-containing protein
MGISGNIFFVYSSDHIARYSVTLNQIYLRASMIVPIIIIVVAEAAFFLVLVSPVTALDWTTETVDSPGDVGWYTSLALDNAGNPRISYMDWTNRHLKYAAKADGGWINETVDTTNAVGEFTSLKLDLSGHPLISYYDGNRGNLSFAMKSGDSWSTVIVDSGGVGRYTSLAVDGSGNPRICYQDLLNAKLKYAAKSGGTWTNETVDNAGNVGTYSSLVLDRSGNPHISYYDAGHGFLKYAAKNGSTWTTVTADNTGNAGYYTSIALDGTGNPHISYYDGINRDLKYATKTGSSWTKEIIDTTGSVGKYTSLVIDDTGNPCISYYDETNGHLKYATKTGIVWTNETADTAVNVGGYTSLALDDSGNPRISYRDGGNGNLKYAIGIPRLILNFTASSQIGSAPLTVQFSDTSTGGSPSLWNWSFGDGAWFNTSVAALRNPQHVYGAPGTYTVNLTVQNLTIVSTLSRSGYITVVAPPNTTVPTTSPTPAPTITSLPTPTPSPTPTLTSSPSPTLTSSPSPTLTSSPTPTLKSSPTPTLAPAEGSGSADDLLPALSSTPVLRGAGPIGCLTVNVGGDSAIRRITVTGQDIADIIVTAQKLTSLPSGVTPMDMPVYQYIDVIPARYTILSAALIEFDVPLFSIADHDASTYNVSLCMLNNSTWMCLPTYRSGSKNGKALYHAESPEFSLFAITIQNKTNIESQKGSILCLSAWEKLPEYESGKTTVTVIPDTPIAPTPVASNTGRSFTIFFLSIMVMIGVVLGATVIRSWWIRR